MLGIDGGSGYANPKYDGMDWSVEVELARYARYAGECQGGDQGSCQIKLMVYRAYGRNRISGRNGDWWTLVDPEEYQVSPPLFGGTSGLVSWLALPPWNTYDASVNGEIKVEDLMSLPIPPREVQPQPFNPFGGGIELRIPNGCAAVVLTCGASTHRPEPFWSGQGTRSSWTNIFASS